MRYIDASSIGAISSIGRSRGGRRAIPAGAGIFSLLFSSKKGRGLSRAKRKKLGRRRFRMFVDNIIMHHKRLHDRNREITIDLTKSRILNKSKDKEKERLSLNKNQNLSWENKVQRQEKTSKIRGRIDARRLRARSRWRSIIEERNPDNKWKSED